MKITPNEIRQHTFEKTFRGYEIEEVDAFLASLSQEWDRVLNESKMLRMQLEIAEKEANKLREIEMTLFKTLKTAEDTSTMITNQANQQAEKQLVDAGQQSEKLMAEAHLKAKSIVKEAEEKASYIKEDVLGEVRDLQYEFSKLEKNKTELITQLRSLATGAIEHVDRFEQKFTPENVHNKVAEAENILAEDTAKPAALAAEMTESAIEIPAVAETIEPEAISIEPEVEALAEVVEPAIEAPAIEEITETTPEPIEVVAEIEEVIETPAAVVEHIAESPAMEAVVEQIAVVPTAVVEHIAESPAVEAVVEQTAVVPAVAAVQNVSEQITDEMLERVNKVKLAIKKAMLEKPDVITKAEEKGGSFFDEI